jgi:pSer/pThr/pTyr-binding forkhead associated (FHA) protein
MKARLFCPTGRFSGQRIEFDTDMLIGRKKGTGATFVLSDNRVSTEHARIRFDGGEDAFYLEDLDSTNGTTLAGVLIVRAERLGQLDVINFGGAGDFVFQILGAGAARGSAEAPVAVTEAEGEGTFVDREGVPLPRLGPPPSSGETGEAGGPETILEEHPPTFPRSLDKDRRDRED